MLNSVTLREIGADTVRQITSLAVLPRQQRFVASNAVSLAEALFSPDAWYRAVYFGDVPAGFVMLSDDTLRPLVPAPPEVFLWRFMVDAAFQRQGVGRAAMALVVEHVRRKGVFSRLLTSYVPGRGCPGPFYIGLGFEPTGEMDDGEVVLALSLGPAPGTLPRKAR